MTIDATQLLKRLDPAVRPAYAAAPHAAGRAPIEHQSFEQLLALASRGGIVSGRQVDVACDLQPPLEASQLERLASAADQAEASGSKRALMYIDGRALVLDVASRTIEAELSSRSEGAAYHVDTAVRVADSQNGPASTLKLPGSGVLPPSIARQFLTSS